MSVDLIFSFSFLFARSFVRSFVRIVLYTSIDASKDTFNNKNSFTLGSFPPLTCQLRQNAATNHYFDGNNMTKDIGLDGSEQQLCSMYPEQQHSDYIIAVKYIFAFNFFFASNLIHMFLCVCFSVCYIGLYG